MSQNILNNKKKKECKNGKKQNKKTTNNMLQNNTQYKNNSKKVKLISEVIGCSGNTTNEGVEICHPIIPNNTIFPMIKNYIKIYSENDIHTKYSIENFLFEEENFFNSIRKYFCLKFHPDVTISNRNVLLDWIMESCTYSRYKRATFHLAIVLIDIYLTKTKNIDINKLQLLGVTSLLLAAKYEVIYF